MDMKDSEERSDEESGGGALTRPFASLRAIEKIEGKP